jgi:peptidyl-prolyl cis-trans isomerase A (cyclophilin A)
MRNTGIDSRQHVDNSNLIDADSLEKVICVNVRMWLTLRGQNQAALADYLGVKAATVSMKMNGRSVWSVPDLVNTANFLGTTPEALMDDSFLEKVSGVSSRAERLDSFQDTYAGSGVGRPRYFRMPELVECPGCDSNTRHLL